MDTQTKVAVIGAISVIIVACVQYLGPSIIHSLSSVTPSEHVAPIPVVADLRALPVITFFNGTPLIVNKGESCSLVWATSNATNVSIDNGVGKVSTSGTKKVFPNKTTTYILTAYMLNRAINLPER